jgi:hypothetical protein
MHNGISNKATVAEDPRHLRVNSLVMRQQSRKGGKRHHSTKSAYNLRGVQTSIGSTCSIKVAARFRPLNFEETEAVAAE